MAMQEMCREDCRRTCFRVSRGFQTDFFSAFSSFATGSPSCKELCDAPLSIPTTFFECFRWILRAMKLGSDSAGEASL